MGRMPEDRMKKALEQLETISEEDHAKVKGLAAIVKPLRSFNHALPMCRSGFPGHFGEPWSGYDAVAIDFVIQYKHLTDAGYNVLRHSSTFGFAFSASTMNFCSSQ